MNKQDLLISRQEELGCISQFNMDNVLSFSSFVESEIIREENSKDPNEILLTMLRGAQRRINNWRSYWYKEKRSDEFFSAVRRLHSEYDFIIKH